jgi:hypothetical protein
MTSKLTGSHGPGSPTASGEEGQCGAGCADTAFRTHNWRAVLPCRRAGSAMAWRVLSESTCPRCRVHAALQRSAGKLRGERAVGRRSAAQPRSCAAQLDARLARLLSVADRQQLGLAVRKETRVQPAVVAHGGSRRSQVDDLHHVRMTVVRTETVLVIATAMRGRHRACGHLREYRLLLHRHLRNGWADAGPHRGGVALRQSLLPVNPAAPTILRISRGVWPNGDHFRDERFHGPC